MSLIILSKQKKDISIQDLKLICNLKDQKWNHGIKSQINWFKKNVKSKDIHNLLFIKKVLVGYVLLRERSCIKNENIKKYLLFDTLIIKEEYQNKGYARIMMNFTNEIIRKKKMASFLICEKEMIKFYQRFNWFLLETSSFKIMDHNFSSNGMAFNLKKQQDKIGENILNFFFSK